MKLLINFLLHHFDRSFLLGHLRLLDLDQFLHADIIRWRDDFRHARILGFIQVQLDLHGNILYQSAVIFRLKAHGTLGLVLSSCRILLLANHNSPMLVFPLQFFVKLAIWRYVQLH